MPAPTGPFRPVVVSANDLRSGAVVYRRPDGRWSGDVAGAEIAASPEAAARLLDLAKADHDACVVVEPALVEIRDGRPVRLRERIRQSGPTAGLPRRERPDVPV
jgi:hypothetical protein